MLFGLPFTYFSTVMFPFAEGPLTAIPAFGTVYLVFGTIIGLFKRERRLLLYLIPFLLSHLLVAVSWSFWGQVSHGVSSWPLYVFVGLQIILVGFIIFVTREAWQASLPLAFFSITYSLAASFIAGMVLTNVWL
jgi:hypothetical protein